jgi:hypothetical protein
VILFVTGTFIDDSTCWANMVMGLTYGRNESEKSIFVVVVAKHLKGAVTYFLCSGVTLYGIFCFIILYTRTVV